LNATSRQEQCRFDGHAVERHGEISARKAISAHVTRPSRFSAKRVVDLLPVDFLGMRRSDEWFRENLPVDFLRVRARGKQSSEK